MRRVGLILILYMLCVSLLLAVPKPLGRIEGSKSDPLAISAISFHDGKLYAMHQVRHELLYYDLGLGIWHQTGIRVSAKAQIPALYINEGRAHLLDSKANSILIYDLEGSLVSKINTRGVKELKFKKASHILVNYQGYIYVLDSTRLYSFSKEGMLLCSISMDNPVSMSLGEDQLIRVLQRSKSGNVIQVLDQNLTKLSTLKIDNPGKKTDYIIDMAINPWGEIHIINSSPISIEKLDSQAKRIPNTRFGSQNNSAVAGAFASPAFIRSTAHGQSSLIAIYDAKQAAIHLFEDTEVQAANRLERPTYTVRHSLTQSTLPRTYDVFPLADRIYSLAALPGPNAKAKASLALICADNAGNHLWEVHLNRMKDKKFKSFNALAVASNKVYVADAKTSLIHIFSAEDGTYQQSFGGKGSQNGKLKTPLSLAISSTGNIFVADRGNNRISVFSEHLTFLENISLISKGQRPKLLRIYGDNLYCLSEDSMIMMHPLGERGGIRKLVAMKKISSFDLLEDGRLAFVDSQTQKLNIYSQNRRQYYFFSQDKKAEFPHFADITMLRYDPWRRRLTIMDSKAAAPRFLHFFAALDSAQQLTLSLNENMQVQLSWEASPGIKHWILEASGAGDTIARSVSQAYYTVEQSQPSVLSYCICPVAEDGKKGIKSAAVEDYFSHAAYQYQNGNFIDAVTAYRTSQQSIRDPRINNEIVKCYIAESDRHFAGQDYERALNELKNASSILGTDSTIALKASRIYKATHDYLGGIKYLEGVNYKAEASLLQDYIELNYLAKDYSKVVIEADRYKLSFAYNETVSRCLAAAYEERGDLQDALSVYQELIAQKPSFDDEYKAAELQYALGQYRAAESGLQLLLTRYPNQDLGMVRYLLGNCSMQNQNYGLAIDHYSAAILYDDGIAKYHHGLGKAYLSDNKPGEALRSLQSAHEMNPQNPDYALDYAGVLEHQNNFEAALAVMEHAAGSVDNSDTATDFHVLHTDLLWQVGRLSDALKEITKAKGFRPDDYSIEQKYQNILAELQVQNLQREVIEIKSVDLRPVYPSLNEYYKWNPIGTITLFNTRDTTVNNVQVSVYVHDVGRRVEIFNVPSLVPGQDKTVDITMDFNERLFDQARRVAVDVKLNFEYEGLSYNPAVPPQYLQILDSKAMNWENRRSLASFVNPSDAGLSYFVRQNIVQTFSNQPSNIIIPNLIKALQAYSFYRANGIRYINDSSRANLDTSTLDEVQFPHQLLKSKSGDCEDLLVLMAGTLESIGIPTALIDIPQHVMLAIQTNMDEKGIIANGLELEYFIEHKGSYLLPLETTMMGKADFVSSWLTAINRYNDELTAGVYPEIIEFSDAHRVYLPCSFSIAIDNSGYQNHDQARDFYQQDLQKISNISLINREMGYVAALEKYPANINVLMQYALFSAQTGKPEKAEQLLRDVLNREPENFAALVNLGNVYAKSSRLDLATQQYMLALPLANGHKDEVYRNLCFMEYRNANRAKALEYFLQMTNKEIVRDVDVQVYADLMNMGD